MRVLLGSKQKKVLQGVIAVLGDNSTSLRSKENAAWILRRVTELSDTAKTQFGGYCVTQQGAPRRTMRPLSEDGLNSQSVLCRST